jgi:hypothetical protein
MKELMIVETRDAAEHRGPQRMAELAAGMRSAAVPTTIFLTENAVFAARSGQHLLDAPMKAGAAVAADGFALKERGIAADELRQGVSVADVGLIVDGLAAGCNVIWR